MRRRNPPSGNVTLNNLTVHNLTAGMLDGAPDDNAEHTLHGHTTVSGAPDTVVLTVEEHAHVQGLLSASRLQVGLTTAPDPGPYDDPYAASPYDDSPYPDWHADGTQAAPEETGFTVDEAGNVRTGGFVVVKHSPGGVILRARDGRYWAFDVDNAGGIATTGRLIGPAPP